MNFFDGLGDIVGTVSESIVDGVSNISKIFYVPGVDGAAGSITFVGFLCLAVLGLSIIGWGAKLVTGLVKQKMR